MSPKMASTKVAPRRLRGSMHEDVTGLVRDMIIRHELKPGQWIGEAKLSQKLGVSRTPLREALKALAAEKLVELHAFRGAAVTDLSPDQVVYLFETQAILESQAIELACARATDQEIAAFAKQHRRMVGFFEKGDRRSYFALNQLLHTAVVGMSHNPVLIEIHASVIVQVERARFKALDIGDRWKQSADQHEDILEALEKRDGKRAALLMREHVLQTGNSVRASLASSQMALAPTGGRRSRVSADSID